jgi:hypothetical protein
MRRQRGQTKGGARRGAQGWGVGACAGTTRSCRADAAPARGAVRRACAARGRRARCGCVVGGSVRRARAQRGRVAHKAGLHFANMSSAELCACAARPAAHPRPSWPEFCLRRGAGGRASARRGSRAVRRARGARQVGAECKPAATIRNTGQASFVAPRAPHAQRVWSKLSPSSYCRCPSCGSDARVSVQAAPARARQRARARRDERADGANCVRTSARARACLVVRAQRRRHRRRVARAGASAASGRASRLVAAALSAAAAARARLRACEACACHARGVPTRAVRTHARRGCTRGASAARQASRSAARASHAPRPPRRARASARVCAPRARPQPPARASPCRSAAARRRAPRPPRGRQPVRSGCLLAGAKLRHALPNTCA